MNFTVLIILHFIGFSCNFYSTADMAEKVNKVYQFKIILHVKPQVWRRIQVAGNSTFKDLHFALQRAMGWESSEMMYHLHKFQVVNPETEEENNIGIYFQEDYELFKTIDHKKVKIADYFIPPDYVTADYEYDFGQSWRHTIILEKIIPAVEGATYPQCIDGEHPPMPEDGVYHGDEKSRPKYFDPKSISFEPQL